MCQLKFLRASVCVCFVPLKHGSDRRAPPGAPQTLASRAFSHVTLLSFGIQPSLSVHARLHTVKCYFSAKSEFEMIRVLNEFSILYEINFDYRMISSIVLF